MPQPENASSTKPDGAEWMKPGTYKMMGVEEREKGWQLLFKVQGSDGCGGWEDVGDTWAGGGILYRV